MAYTKQTWADLPSKTTPINATRLGHIEDGIFNAAATADNAASAAGTAAADVGIVSGKVETLTERVNGLDTAVSNKVDKVAGKGLSTNDYDNTDKGKVDSLGTASTKNSTSVVTQSTDLVESGAVFDAIQGQEQLLDDTVGWTGKNFAVPYDYTYTNTEYSVTYKKNGDIIVNGTPSINSDTLTPVSSVARANGFIYALKAGTYYVSLSGDTNNINPHVVTANGVTIKEVQGTLTLAEDTVVFARIGTTLNTVYNNQTCHIQIERGNVPSTYEPYHKSVEEIKADNSVIGTVEGANASKAWSVGEHFISGGQFKEVTNAIASGEAINSGNTTDKPIADALFNKGYADSISKDLNNIKTSGIYYIASGYTNVPENAQYCVLIVKANKSTDTPNFVSQTILKGDAIYCRAFAGSPPGWSSWYKYTGTIVS